MRIPQPSTGDVVELVVADHRVFEELLRTCRDADADRDATRAELSDLLVAHSLAEEEKVYPALRRRRAIDGEEVEHGEHEHAQTNVALLALLQCKGTDTAKFDTAIEELATLLQHHIGEEEQTILNGARADLAASDRLRLGADFLRRRNALLDEHAGALESVAALVEREQGALDR